MKSIDNSYPIAIVGKLGHGKTTILNRLCGTRFPSDIKPRSCTTTAQVGFTRNSHIPVIDTPGFCSSSDIAAHLAAQKLALEAHWLAGVYVVVKYARADEISELVQKVMDFAGEDDLRLIITHCDTVEDQPGYNAQELLIALSAMLEVPVKNMIAIGRNTPSHIIEQFIVQTRHTPRPFEISNEQLSIISALSVGPRKINKAIDMVSAKIEAASKECHDLITGGKTDASDLAITTNQATTSEMVRMSKVEIFRLAEDMTEAQQNIVYGKAGTALSIRLQSFIKDTNKCLSWDVTDPRDIRNIYKACNHCGAVFIKTSGCDGETTCGNIPQDIKKKYPSLKSSFFAQGSSWRLRYRFGKREIEGIDVLSWIGQIRSVAWGGQGSHVKKCGSVIESGCGRTVNWSTMIPLKPEDLEGLKYIPLETPEENELASKSMFERNMKVHEEKNLALISDVLPKFSRSLSFK